MSDRIERLNQILDGRYRIERELGEGGMAGRGVIHRDIKPSNIRFLSRICG